MKLTEFQKKKIARRRRICAQADSTRTDPAEKTILSLGLPPSIEAALLLAGVATVYALRGLSKDGLLALDGIGRGSVVIIDEALRERGLERSGDGQ